MIGIVSKINSDHDSLVIMSKEDTYEQRCRKVIGDDYDNVICGAHWEHLLNLITHHLPSGTTFDDDPFELGAEDGIYIVSHYLDPDQKPVDIDDLDLYQDDGIPIHYYCVTQSEFDRCCRADGGFSIDSSIDDVDLQCRELNEDRQTHFQLKFKLFARNIETNELVPDFRFDDKRVQKIITTSLDGFKVSNYHHDHNVVTLTVDVTDDTIRHPTRRLIEMYGAAAGDSWMGGEIMLDQQHELNLVLTFDSA